MGLRGWHSIPPNRFWKWAIVMINHLFMSSALAAVIFLRHRRRNFTYYCRKSWIILLYYYYYQSKILRISFRVGTANKYFLINKHDPKFWMSWWSIAVDNYSCGVHTITPRLYDCIAWPWPTFVGIIDYWCFTLDSHCNMSIFLSSRKDELGINRMEQPFKKNGTSIYIYVVTN